MKELNKEQLLFVVVLVVLGAMAFFRLQDRYAPTRVPRSKGGLEVEKAPPCPEIRFPDPGEEYYAPDGRNVFAQPRDWLPLAPLILDLPPKVEITAVAPLPRPALGEAFFDAYHFLPGTPPPGAAAAAEGGAGEPPPAEGGTEAEGTGTETTAANERGAGTGNEGTAASAVETVAGEENVDPEAEYLARYDWIKLKDQFSRIFGYIKNENKYALRRNNEPVVFAQVAKKTGNILGTHEYPRDRIEAFGFADTVVNRIELALQDLNLNAGNLNAIHEKARWCLSLRDEDPAAVEYAVRLAEKAIELDPLSKESYALLADIYTTVYEREKAMEVLREAMAKKLRAPGIYVRYGRLLRAYGMDDAAEDAFREAEHIQPGYAPALAARGALACDQGRYEEAVNLLDAARRSDSWKTELKIPVLLDKARALLGLDRLSEAAVEAQRVVTEDPESGDGWNVKGAVALARGALDEAEEAFQRAGELEPDRWAFVHNLGVTYFWKGDFKGAADRFSDAADLDPSESARPLAGRGFVEECLGEDEQASADYDQAVQVNPLDYYALYLQGRDLKRRGDPEGAVQALRKALRENGRMREILAELGHASLLSGRWEDGAFYFEEYLKRGKGDFRVLYLHGLALLNLNRLDDALARFEAARGMAVNDPSPWNGIAYARYAEGDVDGALDAFGEVLRAFPEGAADPCCDYARKWRDRIENHRLMSQWLDGFQRKEIKNDWELQQRCGPTLRLIDNRVVFQGVQRQEQPGERTALRREVTRGGTFRALEADVAALEGSQATVGISVGSYISRGRQEPQIRAEVVLAVDPLGNLIYNVVDKNEATVTWKRIEYERIPPGRFVRLGIEVADYDNGILRLTADGEPLFPEGLSVKSFRKNSRPLTLGVFTSAAGSRKVHAAADNVRIVIKNG